MRLKMCILSAMLGLAILISVGVLSKASGQDATKDTKKDFSNSPLVTKMMAFNKKGDGKLTRAEVTDGELLRLFDEADTNKDGIVTREELIALAAKLDGQSGQGGGGPGGPGGPGAQGGGPGGGPGGPGGPGGRNGAGGPGGRFGAPAQPGQILSTPIQDRLELTAEQKKDLEALQKEVDMKLARILTDEQKKQLKEMTENRGPGRGPGGPGGPTTGGLRVPPGGPGAPPGGNPQPK